MQLSGVSKPVYQGIILNPVFYSSFESPFLQYVTHVALGCDMVSVKIISKNCDFVILAFSWATSLLWDWLSSFCKALSPSGWHWGNEARVEGAAAAIPLITVCIATLEEKNFYFLAQFMSKWKFSFSSKCPLGTVPLQRNSTENWFCQGSAFLGVLAGWCSCSQVGDSLSDGELHWWNGSMICNKTWTCRKLLA